MTANRHRLNTDPRPGADDGGPVDDPTTLAIRALMAEENAATPEPAKPEPAKPAPAQLEPAQPKPARAKPTNPRRDIISRPVVLPQAEASAPTDAMDRPAKRQNRPHAGPRRGGVMAIMGHIRRFLRRPDAPRILALGALFIVVLVRPWLVVAVGLLALLTAAVVYFSLGPDRVCDLVVRWYTRLRERDPDRAEAIRQRASDASARFAKLLDRLPASWTQGIYVPAFEPDTELLDDTRPDPFDRLAAEARRY
ncbi:hypothetical protein Q4577_11200 [Marinovum sp. 2_MG-2023]|uniref:hypothetical protein n=1 Tax=unclassified Marinovum TaxID=2647166 RepID=UPI0026E34B9F|nr:MULTISPECIES: hypothetical protein [unclassified Marinovum]MDO6730586.1 hypothetical protein [Marinovum sp. 2_MG-2023]MDO6778736.1 hypothetical protein [Marinovum sp. 1_MG-2023]